MNRDLKSFNFIDIPLTQYKKRTYLQLYSVYYEVV